MRKLIIIICGMALVFGVTTVAGAIPISGELILMGPSFDSSFVAETANILPAITGTGFGTGSLIALNGIQVTTNSFIFNPAATPAASPLWTAGEFSFSLESVSVVVQEGNHLGLTGKGTISSTAVGSDLDDTFYFWDLNITDADKMFSFSQSQGPAPVPEPATMLLLGTGLIGLAGFARKKKRS